MALKIYETTEASSVFSSDGTFSNPITHSFDGVIGGTIITQYYLRNDNDARYYNNITLLAYVESGQDITDGTSGFSWKLISGSSQPLEQEWTLVDEGNTLSMDDIGSLGAGDDITYYPFWLRIRVPNNLSPQAFNNIKLRISYTENIA